MPKAATLEVLIVDDQPSMRGLTKYVLQQIGFAKFTEAKNGRDALGKLQFSNFDLVISDWNMDDIDGLTLLKVLRKHPKTAKLPFIMATGQGDKEQVRVAIEAGVNNYLLKPFDATTMRKKIEAVLGPLN
jgi:two-component system, chemotaxis family, chemotaxis protein CheY